VPLTVQMQAVLEAMRAAGLKPVDELAPEEARAQFSSMATARRSTITPVARTQDRRIAANGRQIPVRLYWPQRSGSLPAIVYFHGGGHVIGNVDTHDEVTRVYCAGAEALVISVDYAKGPENKFPAAVEDVRAVINWLHANATELAVDRARIALAGDSAGGNLAAVGAIHVRDSGLPQLALQVLVYPVIDFSLSSDSYRRYETGYGFVSAKAMAWFRSHYLAELGDADDWRASPIRVPSLAGLAPAYVVTAEYDVLHDEGIAYITALRNAGVQVEHREYRGVIHGFFVMSSAVDEASAAQREAVDRLRSAFARNQ
jgi:acetyl esterase